MDIVRACLSIADLQTLVDAEIWRGNEISKNAIQERAVEIALSQGLHRIDLYHPEWLADVINDDIDDEWVVQQGGSRTPSDWKKHCIVSEEFNQHVKRFNISGHAFIIKFKNMSAVSDLNELLVDLFEGLLRHVNAESADVVGVELRHPDLDHPILIPFRCDHSPSVIMRDIERVIQSNASLCLDDKMEIQITKVKIPEGSGRKRKFNECDVKEFVKYSRCMIEIPGHDNLCLPRALVTAIALAVKDPQWDIIRKGDRDRKRLQLNRAIDLIGKVGLQDHKREWTITQVRIFQEYLVDYPIKIFTSTNCSDCVFLGPSAAKCLNLFLHENHYTVVTKMTAFLNTSYYCVQCNKSFSNREDHRYCLIACDRCLQIPKCEGSLIYCSDCCRWFAGQLCFNNHKNNLTAQSVCQRVKWCLECKVEYCSRKKHECGVLYCKICKENKPRGAAHQCYMPNYKSKKGAANGYIFFDFESEQVKVVGESRYGSQFLHEPVCVVVHKVCDKCWENRDMFHYCCHCITRKRVFTGSNLLSDFVIWLFSPENHGCIAMAHNFQGYDGQLILEYLQKNAVNKPEVIFRGMKIMRLCYNDVTLLDSLNFLPMALSAIPGAFNLTEFKKGYFPHLFTCMENWDYVGAFPDAYFYQPASMKQKQKEKFFQWYLGVKNGVFNFRRELIDYCNSDVDILKMGVMTFRKTFMTQTGLDPYWNAMTISDACIKVFRLKYLPVKTIGLIPQGEYRSNDRYSVMAMKWLKWIAEKEKIRIRHAMNGGEVELKVGGHKFKVDGICGSTVFEYNGCIWHGCPDCFKGKVFLPLTGKLSNECYRDTVDRTRMLEAAGYTVIEMWECKLKAQLKMNPSMFAFFDNLNIIEPIRARDAYFGGRTNVTKLYHKTLAGEQIHYIDICSLYPYICKYGIFPVGHPKIITENFLPIDQKPYQGLIKCRVLPSKTLYHPVLPLRMHCKLMFPLCLSCAQAKNRGSCNHNNDERSFWGTWVTLEIYKAIDLGYKVLDISEVWDYGNNVAKYGEIEGLFTDYVNEFLRLKQEASDWPKSCKTPEEREQFLREYEEHEGIKLDPNNISKNPGLRALCKLCLNSFYGKFGQRENMSKCVCLTEPHEFYEIVSDPTNAVSNVRAWNEKMVEVRYEKKEGFEEPLCSVNVVIAAYVTAQARLKLHSYLELLQKDVLYFDTDSIVYVYRPETPLVPTGSYLGDMTNELEDYGIGAYISEFVSAGPKNYAYIVQCPNGKCESVVKIRGFTLDSITAKRLNFKTLKNKVFAFARGGFQEETTGVMWKIVRTKEGFIKTAPQSKTYSLVVDKRWVTDDFMSYPYGY